MDIQLAFNGSLFDLSLAGSDLATDAGLETAVTVSLFSDAAADPDDLLPDNSSDRRGWWGDSFAEIPGDRLGSKLWLLAREKHLPGVARRVEEYAAAALAWLLIDQIASRIVCTAVWLRPGACSLTIEIHRPNATPYIYRFANLWEALYAL